MRSGSPAHGDEGGVRMPIGQVNGDRDMTTELSVRVENKLFHNRYLVDAGRAHIRVRPHTVPSPALLSLLKACPARCYELNDKGQVEIAVDGCVECGTCRIIGEPTGDIEWSYPRGGYGVLFKFG
jgi:ferredoxin like protein